MAMKNARTLVDSDSGNENIVYVDSTNTGVIQPNFGMVPIAAIGASAGGLEPIEHFFDAMPADSGCAFVVIQHLSPDFRSLMHELLSRHSSMKIHRIEDGMKIEPNSIYLNTPRTVTTVTGNTLRVEKIESDATIYLPIDLFFRSLAKERGTDAITLVLSGTGTDGTKGCQSIKDAGGNVLVQDPKTTRFASMANSVIAEGYHNTISSPAGLAAIVHSALKNESHDEFQVEEFQPNSRQVITDPFEDIISILQHNHGTDFSQYKDATIHRRIDRRAYMRGIKDIEEYRNYLHSNTDELLDLYADLLIEVTDFFRDEEAFALLRSNVLPDITRNLKDNQCLRVWVPGCASGEEAYSLAILLQEQARISGITLRLKIMATDIHTRSMNQASSGAYNEAAIKNVPIDLAERYFDCAEGQARIKPLIRNMVFFSTHDVTRDPPFINIDLISCRNLLIYLKESTQEKVVQLLHFALRKDGYLFLGPSEHIGKTAHEFETINEKWRIYKKRRNIKLLEIDSIFRESSANPAVTLNSDSKSNTVVENLQYKRAHRSALEAIVTQYAPPGFLLTEDGTIVHVFGNAAELITMSAGAFSRKIVDLIIPELKVVVTTAIDQSQQKGSSQLHRVAYVNNREKSSGRYEVSLSNLDLPDDPSRFLLLCIEKKQAVENTKSTHQAIANTDIKTTDTSALLQQRIAVLESNLRSSEENLQSTIEELETSNEELQSTNEELMSANEEMQSTNEELHSVNEELYTVSAEYQRKNEELTERETDINVLLNSSKIGTVHLDTKLCLRRYTNNSLSVFNILPQDIGRSINHITIVNTDQDILGLIYSTNKKGETHEIQVTVDHKVYLLRIMPYDSVDHHHNGVMITVIDISDIEYIKSKLAELDLQYRDILECTDSYFVKWDAQTNAILFCNEPYAKRWGTTSEKLIGQNIFSIRSEEDQQTLRNLVNQLAPNETDAGIFSVTYPDGKLSHSNVFTRSISEDGINIDAYQTNGFDCTDEYNYRAIVEQLFSIVANDTLDFHERLAQILQIGLDYYSLDTAIISMILGETYEITCVIGKNPQNLKIGSKLNLQDTLCSVFVESGLSLAIDDVSHSEYSNLPCQQNTDIESFVGSVVNTACGPYGTVNFSSSTSRSRAFSEQDENLCMLIGGWVSFLIGNLEQLEFMGNQNEYYNSLFLTVPTMMFLCDEDGLIISCSNRLCEKLGLDVTTVPGKNCVKHFDVDDKEALKRAVKIGSANRLPLVFEVPNKPVLEAELNCTIKPIGTIQGVRMAVLVDVTERNTVLRKAENQNQLLISANENLNQFAFIASHDLQEPLRKIQQFSHFLEEDLEEKLTGDAKYHLEVIVDASERMSTLIYDLLRYSGASQEEPDTELVSLNSLLAEVQVELEISIAESNAIITIGDLPEVTGDKGLLRQLFVNLVSNSIKYRAKDRALEISVSSSRAPFQNGLEISDNGIGFDMSFATKIFEPFNRLHNNEEYKGNGIGLAICSKVCEKHHWTLSAESQLGVGSNFIINFNH